VLKLDNSSHPRATSSADAKRKIISDVGSAQLRKIFTTPPAAGQRVFGLR
jgi:hypothetical protein